HAAEVVDGLRDPQKARSTERTDEQRAVDVRRYSARVIEVVDGAGARQQAGISNRRCSRKVEGQIGDFAIDVGVSLQVEIAQGTVDLGPGLRGDPLRFKRSIDEVDGCSIDEQERSGAWRPGSAGRAVYADSDPFRNDDVGRVKDQLAGAQP